MKPFEFKSPESVDSALEMAQASTDYIAGGTNQIDLMKKQISTPDVILDISKSLSEEIKVSNKGIRIGAMVRNTNLTLNEEILKNYKLISKAVLAGASPQIRNMASTAGNLLQRTRCPYFYDSALPCNKRVPGSGCGALDGDNRMSAILGYSQQCVAVHPSDLCVALVALDAEVHIVSKDNKEQIINFIDFHRLPGNTPQKDTNLPDQALITEIHVPKNNYNHSTYLKIRDRTSYAFALISVAVAMNLKNNKINNIRLASGGVAHKPWRWQVAENFLKGKTASKENFIEAAEIALKDAKPLSENAYKIPMLKGAIVTALTDCLNSKTA